MGIWSGPVQDGLNQSMMTSLEVTSSGLRSDDGKFPDTRRPLAAERKLEMPGQVQGIEKPQWRVVHVVRAGQTLDEVETAAKRLLH